MEVGSDVTIEIEGAEIRLECNEVGPQTKKREPNKANFNVEEIEGMSWSAKLGRFVSYRRKIDRGQDYYFELVTDGKTGEVLRKCEEPHSIHTGRGSAKTGNNTK